MLKIKKGHQRQACSFINGNTNNVNEEITFKIYATVSDLVAKESLNREVQEAIIKLSMDTFKWNVLEDVKKLIDDK